MATAAEAAALRVLRLRVAGEDEEGVGGVVGVSRPKSNGRVRWGVLGEPSAMAAGDADLAQINGLAIGQWDGRLGARIYYNDGRGIRSNWILESLRRSRYSK